MIKVWAYQRGVLQTQTFASRTLEDKEHVMYRLPNFISLTDSGDAGARLYLVSYDPPDSLPSFRD